MSTPDKESPKKTTASQKKFAVEILITNTIFPGRLHGDIIKQPSKMKDDDWQALLDRARKSSCCHVFELNGSP